MSSGRQEVRKTMKAINLNQHGCISAVSLAAKFDLLRVQMRICSEGTPARSTHVAPTGYHSGGLIGIPAASADPNALCWVREIKAADITGISDRRCSDRSPQVAALIREYRTWTRRRRAIYFSRIKPFTYQF